mgnify:CR=1 FL=1
MATHVQGSFVILDETPGTTKIPLTLIKAIWKPIRRRAHSTSEYLGFVYVFRGKKNDLTRNVTRPPAATGLNYRVRGIPIEW